MPRLTDASRQARRDAIAEAALRVLQRRGVAHTSIADIVEELGGSAGGVYSHFASKAEIVRFIAASVYSTRTDAIADLRDRAAPPIEILESALGALAADAPTGIIVQLWGEASVDPEMHAVVVETLDAIESSLRAAVLPWARRQPGDSEARADRLARAMRAVSQGYIVQLSLFGTPAADAHLAGLTELAAATA
jgi:AcrR family transcriptional regulator